jgi:hypothetical protein
MVFRSRTFLRENAISCRLKPYQKEYQGQWIALNEGVLLGAGESLVELYKTIKKSGQLSVALFINLKMEAI